MSLFFNICKYLNIFFLTNQFFDTIRFSFYRTSVTANFRTSFSVPFHICRLATTSSPQTKWTLNRVNYQMYLMNCIKFVVRQSVDYEIATWQSIKGNYSISLRTCDDSLLRVVSGVIEQRLYRSNCGPSQFYSDQKITSELLNSSPVAFHHLSDQTHNSGRY